MSKLEQLQLLVKGSAQNARLSKQLRRETYHSATVDMSTLDHNAPHWQYRQPASNLRARMSIVAGSYNNARLDARTANLAYAISRGRTRNFIEPNVPVESYCNSMIRAIANKLKLHDPMFSSVDVDKAENLVKVWIANPDTTIKLR